MQCKAALLIPVMLTVAACNSTGGLKVPFEKEKPFVATEVPADFAVIVDENHDTYYTRQHIRQQISVSDAMSTTAYTTRRDYNNTVSSDFSQETPLSPVQLQDMWNDVSRYNLMLGSSLWINWRSDADIYRRNSYTLQIRANGRTRTYTATNGFSGNLRPLMLKVEAVRLPITQDSKTRVVGGEEGSAAPEGPKAPSSQPKPDPRTAPGPTLPPKPYPDPGIEEKPAAPVISPSESRMGVPGAAPATQGSILNGMSDGMTVVPANAGTVPVYGSGGITIQTGPSATQP